MSAPKILMVAGDAAESLEVLYPYQRLQEEGYDVQIAAPSKKKLHFVVHDFEPGYDTYTEKPGYSWDADLAFKDVKPDDYVALVIPGERTGKSGVWQPFALAAAGVLKGRKTAAYPALAPDVKAAGAEFVDSGAVVDGQMVSARAWPDHPTWMRAFIRLLKQKAPVKEPELAATR